jgi:O-antigen ligase
MTIDEISSGRIDLYQFSINKFLRHPIFGNGLGFPVSTTNVIESFRPHNIFLEALVQGGIINFIIILLAIYFPLKTCYALAKRDTVSSAILVSCLAVLIHGMLEPNLFSFSMDIYFWTFMGFAVAKQREIFRRARS